MPPDPLTSLHRPVLNQAPNQGAGDLRTTGTASYIPREGCSPYLIRGCSVHAGFPPKRYPAEFNKLMPTPFEHQRR